MIRLDVEPRFLTFRSFNAVGWRSTKIFTDQNFSPFTWESKITDDKEFDLKSSAKLEK